MAHQRGHREAGDIEVGAASFFQKHVTPHVAPSPERPSWLLTYERRRPRWFTELFAEAFGVFLYCWGGMGATAAFYTSLVAKEVGFGSILSIALSYAFAIALAITLVGPTSGSHLNPCFTIAFAVFKGFPWRKVPQYICAQIFGGMIAGLIVYAQFRTELYAITQELQAAGAGAAIFSTTGPANPIALFAPAGSSIGIIFVNEFVATVIIGLGVFSILDPSNVFIAPQSGPLLIGLLYFVSIVCYASNGIALNTARDLGGRIAAAIIWGGGAFTANSSYTALAALTNIAGTLVGASIQILLLSDTNRPPTPQSAALHCIAEQAAGKTVTPRTEAAVPAMHVQPNGKHEVDHHSHSTATP